MIRRGTALLVLAAFALGSCQRDEMADMPPVDYSDMSVKAVVVPISVNDLEVKLETRGVVLIDVRTPSEFAAGRIRGAFNAPLDYLDVRDIPVVRRRQTILYSGDDNRARIAAQRLADRLGRTVRFLDGGVPAWIDAGRTLVVARAPEDPVDWDINDAFAEVEAEARAEVQEAADAAARDPDNQPIRDTAR